MLNDFNLTSTESDFLRSPFDEVIEVAPPQGKLFFYQSQLSLLTLEVSLIKWSLTKYNNIITFLYLNHPSKYKPPPSPLPPPPDALTWTRKAVAPMVLR